MAKPTYEELEEKVRQLEQEAGHIRHLEDQLKFLESQFMQVEKQLRERQRMDSLGTLAQGVAHDFNNILSGIMAYLNILSLTSDNFSPSQKTYVENIINSVKRGAATIKQFQKLSRSSKSEKADIDLYTVAREVFHMLDETTDKMIEKRMEIQKGVFFVCADINELHQVFMNLGTNAVHAIEEKGVQKGDFIRIGVTPSPLSGTQINLSSPDEFYEICFEDSGAGMSREVVEKAFEPLFTTKKGCGKNSQGLGLAMVHDIVTKRHGGHIEIDSERGRGTAFRIFLPKTDDACGMEDVELTIQGGDETIFVVDDDDSVRESIRTALEDFGYKVITARDGEEGLAIYQAHHKEIRAVLLDMVMPKMSGKELLGEMLKINPEVRVIISSGHGEDQYTEPIIKSAKNYLTKPFEIDLLESTLRQVLDDV